MALLSVRLAFVYRALLCLRQMRFDIITIFPEVFEPYLNTSILGRAKKRGVISVHTHNLRNWAAGKHKQVDGKPYGGGAGMVLMAEPILRAVSAVKSKIKNPKSKIVVFSAKGKQFNQKMAQDWAKKYKQLIFVTGRYEGIDERVVKALKAEEVSIGPYVLTDGDVAAMAVISAVTRLLSNVIKWESLQEESHWNLLLKDEEKKGKGLEYPHYTRPEVFKYKGKTYRVPRILLSGDHSQIAAWRSAKQK